MKEQKLKEIAKFINEKLENKMNSFGLLAGDFGEIFFLYYYSLIDPTYQHKADKLLDTLIDSFSEESYFHTYCGGLAGLGVGLHLLEDEGFIEGTAEMMEDINLLLAYNLNIDIERKNYDFLHGAIGLGFYFLKHYQYAPEVSIEQINKLINFLNSNSLHDEKSYTLKWQAPELYKGKDVGRHSDFNISLSHGMSSIIIFLSRIIELNIGDFSQLSSMLNKACNYILSQRIDEKKYGCYFPSTSIECSEELFQSRLGWCYGDLGVALALWHAAKALNREDLKELSLEVFRFSAQRRDLNQNHVLEAGICHGASGITQIFYRMYLETGLPEFKDTYDYWQEVTLKMACHEDGWGGYKFHHGKKGWVNSSSILEGIAGVGLSLLSSKNSNWDEILLLSFK